MKPSSAGFEWFPFTLFKIWEAFIKATHSQESCSHTQEHSFDTSYPTTHSKPMD